MPDRERSLVSETRRFIIAGIVMLTMVIIVVVIPMIASHAHLGDNRTGVTYNRSN
jgi:hypothetical protein